MEKQGTPFSPEISEEAEEQTTRGGRAFAFDPTVYRGREGADGRGGVEKRVYDILDRLGVAYWRMDHDPAATIADCERVDQTLGTSMCKNLFLCTRNLSQFYLLMLPGAKQFHTKDLTKQIGSSRLSFADAAHMEEFLSIRPGAVSCLGLLFDTKKRVELLIDRQLLEEPYIGCHPCVNTSSLRIATADLIDTILPYSGHGYRTVTL